MKENNNKGYFLAETVIVLALVAGLITTLYANSMKTYINRKNNLVKYNTVDGLYSTKIVKEYLYSYETELKSEVNDNGYILVNDYLDSINVTSELFSDLNIDKVYLSSYDMNKILSTDIFSDNIKSSLENITNDGECDYRYIAIFNDSSYATVGLKCAK